MDKNKIVEIEFPRDDQNDDIESISYEISSWGADLSFRELVTMYKEDELAKPDIQRRYVWTKREASRFIESILLGLPIPSIFLAEYGSQKLIIDGYQRIMSIFDYIEKKKFADENQIFKLINSNVIAKKWRGKAFEELDTDEQRKIRSTTIHAIVFSQKEPKQNYSSLYQVFERINTGGQKLTAQEIRNCIYQCKFNKILIDLNTKIEWRSLLYSETPDSRMLDIDLMLRYFALSKELSCTSLKQLSLKKIENDFMESAIKFDDTLLQKYSQEFNEIINTINSNFGSEAFCNYSSETKQFTNKPHAAILDSLMIATKIFLDKNSTIPTNIKELWEEVRKNNTKYREYITERTTLTDHIKGRIKIILQDVYKVDAEI